MFALGCERQCLSFRPLFKTRDTYIKLFKHLATVTTKLSNQIQPVLYQLYFVKISLRWGEPSISIHLMPEITLRNNKYHQNYYFFLIYDMEFVICYFIFFLRMGGMLPKIYEYMNFIYLTSFSQWDMYRVKALSR